jgi:hypothetical protein
MTKYYGRYLDERERHRRWLDPRLHQVRVANIVAYLQSRGWKPVPPDRPHVLIFQEPVLDPDGPLYQSVPENEHGRDYLFRIYELIAAVAEIEDRYAGDVLTDILRQPVEAAPSIGSGVPLPSEPASK